MLDGRHVGKYSTCHNSPTNGPTGTQLAWSHPIMFSTCPPCCGCHGNGRVPSNDALNILQLWASGDRTRGPISMKFGTQQHVRTTMTATWSNITVFKIQNGGRPPCWKIVEIPYSPSNGPFGTKLGWSHPITFPTCPPQCGCHGNGGCLVTAHWTFSSYGRLEAERVNQFWWNLVYNSNFGQQWQSRDQILKFLKFKMADDRCWKMFEMP